jgi:phosphotriesterase-related protein
VQVDDHEPAAPRLAPEPELTAAYVNKLVRRLERGDELATRVGCCHADREGLSSSIAESEEGGHAGQRGDPMSTVQTVRGPVDAAELGTTLMHEHVFIMQPEALQNWGHAFGPVYWDEDERLDDAVAKLNAVRDAGIRTIVDPTAPGLGRYIPRLQTLNRAVDLNIVVATGLYAFLELPNFLGYRRVEAIAELFIRELREGIDDTGVKAAFLKCAVERHGVIGDVPRILAAIAAASIETGAPVMVHTNAQAQTGRDALEVLTGHGVDPQRIVIAHAGDSNDLEYLRAIADTGAWLGCDRFGIEHFNPLPDRINTLVALLAEGYGNRIHLSHDAACFMDFMVGDPAFANEKPDYLLISNQVVPALMDAGVTQAQIDEMMVANPRRFLTGERDTAVAGAASLSGSAPHRSR